MSKYYLVQGKTFDKIMAVCERRQATHKKIMKWAKSFGAKGAKAYRVLPPFYETVVGLTFPSKTKAGTPDPKIWRQHYNRQNKDYDDWYVPNLSTKQGKEVASEMRKFRIEGRTEIANIIGMDFLKLPGVRIYERLTGTMLIVAVDDGYKPKRSIAKDMDRISDIEAEAFAAEHSKKGKRK